MARIIGGIGTSHTPTIGFAVDGKKQNEPAWSPIFAAYAPLKAWLADKKPDVIFFVYNDHVTSFFFDHYSAFALGVGAEFSCADEGAGSRNLPPIQGHPRLARHIAESLMAEEFDLSLFQNRPLDHGCFSPLSALFDHGDTWPVALIPLAVGVLQNPVPSARRCWKLGQALRRAIESFPENIRVAVVSTGGLSHQVSGKRAGFNAPHWDEEFLELVISDPETLARMTQAEFALKGGWESAEAIMWLVMRGALSANVDVKARHYYLPSMTGIATLLLENLSAPVAAAGHVEVPVPAELTPPQTYPFTLETSVTAFKLNQYLHRMIDPVHRALFTANEEESLRLSGLSAKECELIRRRDWSGLIQAGAIFFGLEKLAAVLGLPNAAVYAAMRGENLETFQKSRNAPGALYSVGSTLK
jgi:gallate dioxygenase